jgi:hypothetical protein
MGWKDAPEVSSGSWQSAPLVGAPEQSIGRTLGLTARAGIEGVGDTLDTLAYPIRYGINTIFNPPKTWKEALVGSANDPIKGHTGTAIADLIGLPSPVGTAENLGSTGARTMAGVATFGGGAKSISNLIDGNLANAAKSIFNFKPTAPTVSNSVAPELTATLDSMAAAPAQQLAGGAAGGMAGEYTKEHGGGPVAQFLASLAGGFTGAAGAASVERGANLAKSIFSNATRPATDETALRISLEGILGKQGMSLSDLPHQVRSQLMDEMRQAQKVGGSVDPAVIGRLADYAAVGATPTRGTVTLDPVQITREQNTAKLGANSGDNNLGELARLKNKNNDILIEGLNKMGANGAYANDPYAAGTVARSAIEARDAQAKAVERFLYGKAKDSSGRALDLDRESFVLDAYKNLAESNKGAFLPSEIGSLIEQIRAGSINLGGTKTPTPFNVDVIDNLKTVLGAASRKASAAGDGNAVAAIKNVRDALENTPIKAVGRSVGGDQAIDPTLLAGAQNRANTISQEAMDAFDRARSFARSRRQWQESAPGIEAGLNDYTAENFVKDFILSRSNRAGFDDAATLLKTVGKNPAAKEAVRQAVLGHLKEKALSKAADDVGIFGKGFSDELVNIGDRKLGMLFSPQELAQLKAIARVSRYDVVQPRGSAPNNSNTVGAIGGLLEKIGNNPVVSHIPYVKGVAPYINARIQSTRALSPLGAALVEQAKTPVESLPPSALAALLLQR